MKTEAELLYEMIEAYVRAKVAKERFIEADRELAGRVNLVSWVRGKL